MYNLTLRSPRSEFETATAKRPGRQLRYKRRRPLTQARLAPPARGLYRIFRHGRLVYVGESGNLRKRLMQHLWCLTHFKIVPAAYQFSYALMPRSTPKTRRGAERDVIKTHRSKLAHQRESEAITEDKINRLIICYDARWLFMGLLRMIQDYNKKIRLLRRLEKQKPRNQDRVYVDKILAQSRRKDVGEYLELLLSRVRSGYFLERGCTRKDLAKMTYITRKLRGPWRYHRKTERLRDKLVYWLRHSRGAYAKASCARLFGRKTCREVKRLIRDINRSGMAAKP